MNSILRTERIAGCLLAGAVGDAMGAAYEGTSSVTSLEVPEVLRVTDDTQLTIATCEAIAEHGSVDPQAIADRFAVWFRQRRITGIGSSTLKALTELAAGGHWALVGASGERAAGNGAAMRVAPLAFHLDPDDDSDRQKIRDVCRITHRHDEAYVGALAVVYAIRHAARGEPLNADCLNHLAGHLPDSQVRDRLLASSAMQLVEFAATFGTSGFVAESVPCALLAASQADNFLDMVRGIIRCGGDTDTIASMAGQIYGAQHGPEEVRPWTQRLDAYGLLQEVLGRLS